MAHKYQVFRHMVDGEGIGQTWQPFTYVDDRRIIAVLNVENGEDGNADFITVLTEVEV